MKKVFAIVLVLALILSMVACGGGKTAEPDTAAETPGTLGVVMPNATHGFLGESIAHAKAEADAIAAETGMTVKFLTSAESSEQNNQIDQLIADGVDCIVLWPHNGDEVRSSAQAVMDAGIPLIIYDRLINGFKPTAE
ncbi:MAG TPA: substrate-binding domain-containing protein, partial [Anaerovoracaceae bacterium]|nr:substrate-binding domain-containing protein [Anaerovoracaceae bacterium]